MKKLGILVLLSFLTVGLTIEAHAIPSFPRDLVCENQSGAQVILKSNNSFWSQAQNGRYNVKLLLNRGLGEEVIPLVAYVNNVAQRIRGNDEGNRRYIFISNQGEELHVELEFLTNHGVATGIKTFQVISSSFQFQYAPSSGGLCQVVYFNRIEI